MKFREMASMMIRMAMWTMCMAGIFLAAAMEAEMLSRTLTKPYGYIINTKPNGTARMLKPINSQRKIDLSMKCGLVPKLKSWET